MYWIRCGERENRTTFVITITDCEMESIASAKMIYVLETTDVSGGEIGVDANSVINVESCVFDDDPLLESVPQYSLVKYPNNQPPQLVAEIEKWICG